MPPEDPAVRAEAVLSAFERHANPGQARVFRFMGLVNFEAEAHGAWVRDVAGQEYLDCASGYGVMGPGYGHPAVVAAVQEQLTKQAMSSRVLLSEPTARLAERLAGLAPGDLEYCFFCNSGAEAVEGALKFARVTTGRPGFVAALGAFHGKTFGALSVSGRDVYRRPFEPLLPGVTHVPFGDAAALDRAVGPGTAAVILEPIQGEGGVILPPDGYLAAAREICDRAGALLILDEVQTGMGRTGRLFACEHWGVVPDLMCLAKALGGGVMPIGAVVGTERAFSFFAAAPLLHTSTFGGNPLACAAALATLEVMEREDLPGQAARKGARLLGRLADLAARYPRTVREVRGKGLMIGLEMTREGAGGALMASLLARRVLAVHTLNNERVIRVMPPLVITDAELDRATAAFTDALAEVDAVVEEL